MLCDVNRAIRTLSANVPVTSQKMTFCTRSVQPHPPARISAERHIIRPPRAIVQCSVWMSALHSTSVGQPPTRPIPCNPGARPIVTNAIPKKAFDNNPARVIQKDEINPTIGWITRLTNM